MIDSSEPDCDEAVSPITSAPLRLLLEHPRQGTLMSRPDAETWLISQGARPDMVKHLLDRKIPSAFAAYRKHNPDTIVAEGCDPQLFVGSIGDGIHTRLFVRAVLTAHEPPSYWVGLITPQLTSTEVPNDGV
jgi:hypothetical protein